MGRKESNQTNKQTICYNLPDNEIGVFEEFVAIMYDRSNGTNKINEAHLEATSLLWNFSLKSRPCWAYKKICLTSTTYMGAIALQVAKLTIAIQLGLG